MKITDIRVRTVLVPLEAPLRHSTGVHPGRFIRTILEIFTDEGIVGLGEVGGGDQRSALLKLKSRIVGEDPFNLERIKQKTLRQIYYLSNSRLYAAIENACLDIQGKAANRPLCDLLGGKLRDKVPFSAYLFFRYREGDVGGETTPEEIVAHTKQLIADYGFRSLKLKGGVLPPREEIAVMYALREALGPAFGLRIDPNGKDRGMNPYYHGRGIFRYDPTLHATPKPSGGADFTVGARYAVGSMLREATKGKFGGLAVFKRALTTAEMKKLHDAANIAALHQPSVR